MVVEESAKVNCDEEWFGGYMYEVAPISDRGLPYARYGTDMVDSLEPWRRENS
jgi:hypothetical protein